MYVNTHAYNYRNYGNKNGGGDRPSGVAMALNGLPNVSPDVNSFGCSPVNLLAHTITTCYLVRHTQTNTNAQSLLRTMIDDWKTDYVVRRLFLNQIYSQSYFSSHHCIYGFCNSIHT